MGFFIEPLPVKDCLTLRPVVGMWDSCGRGRRQCDQPECEQYSAWPHETDGRRLCYFHSSYTASEVGHSPAFDDCLRHIESFATDDECHVSAAYLRDHFDYLAEHAGEIDTLVEVGCYMGGLSAVFAGLAVRHGWRLYIIDVMLPNLVYTFQRLVQLYPQAAGMVRLYCGTFPEFVAESKEELHGRRVFVELDTVHTFENAVRELSATWHIRDAIHSVSMHGFNYRSQSSADDLHADHALFAVFGLNADILQIGSCVEGSDCPISSDSDNPHYLKAGLGEGVIIALDKNHYCFEHGAAPAPVTVPTDHRQKPNELEIIFPEHSYSPWPMELLIGLGVPPRLGTLDGVFERTRNGVYRQLLADAPISLKSRDPGIVRIEGSSLVGVASGQTTVTVSHKGRTRKIPVTVVKLDVPDTAVEEAAAHPGAALRMIERSRVSRKLGGPPLFVPDSEQLRREIESLKQSESYRLGLLLLSPIRLLKRLLLGA